MEKAKKAGRKYNCELCHFHSNDKTMYQRHLKTNKHKKSKAEQKVERNKYCCEACQFYSNDKTKFDRHRETTKHKGNVEEGIVANAAEFQEPGLVALNQMELQTKLLNMEMEKMEIQNNMEKEKLEIQTKLFNMEKEKLEIQNNMEKAKMEFQTKMEEKIQERLVSTLKEMIPQMAPTNITNNTNNTNNITNRISNNQINIFLSEKCAGAMSIQQFAKRLAYTIDDVLLKKHDVLVKVITQNLEPLKDTERPVHCSNAARRKWHVKDETDGWCKDDGSTLIRRVTNGLMGSPLQYIEEFPDWNTNPNRLDEYIQIIQMTSSDMEPKAEARVLTHLATCCDLGKALQAS